MSGSAGSKDLASLRVCFSIKQWSIQAPNMASFRVYNPSPTTVAALTGKEYTGVQFYAGYQDHTGLVFSGDIKQTITGHETVSDSYIDIFAADSEQAYNNARVTKTLSSGYKPQDKLNAALDALKPFGVTMGKSNVDLSQPVYPRGLPLLGMARDVIRQVALSAGATWSFQLGKLDMISPTKDLSGGAVLMNSKTGMVWWPQQTPDGIVVKSLLNPALQPNTLLQIDQSSIQRAQGDNNPLTSGGSDLNLALNQQGVADGVYRIFHLDRQGDTRGSEWYDISTCIGAKTGSLPNSQIGLGYS